MSLIIREVWALYEQEDKEPEYRPLTVISMFKAVIMQSQEKESMSTEIMRALCFYEDTGEIVDIAIGETFIKTLTDEKDRKLKTFSSPTATGGAGKENRPDNSPDNRPA